MAKDYSEYKKKYEALQKKTAGTGRGGLKSRPTPKASTDAREALLAKFRDPAQRQSIGQSDFDAITSPLRRGTVPSSSAKAKPKPKAKPKAKTKTTKPAAKPVGKTKKIVNKPVAKKPATTTKSSTGGKPKLSTEKREKRAERLTKMERTKSAIANKRKATKRTIK